MRLKMILVSIVIMLISLYSCEDKTQTTQTQVKSDIDLTLSPVYSTDSAQARVILPRIIGYITNNSIDSITSVNYYTIISDTSGGNLRKYFYLKYNDQFNNEKELAYKYYDLNDLDNENNPMGISNLPKGGYTVTCEGVCNCIYELSGAGFKCECTSEPPSACLLKKTDWMSYNNTDNVTGLNIINNISVCTFSFQNDYIIVYDEE